MIEQPQSQGFFVEFFFLAEKGVVGKLIFVVGLFFSLFYELWLWQLRKTKEDSEKSGS
ncbi:hypothetical protein [Parasutterella excrementihominis]|nr:hypothetical protein [Parasutterella excrementihominis]